MYKATFGTRSQITFNSESEYYELLGYLAKGDGTTRLVNEPNDLSGAWTEEGRIHFYTPQPDGIRANLLHTAGTGNIVTRVNCNEFVDNIITNHQFQYGETQETTNIRATVPAEFLEDFDNGLQL